MMRTFFALGCGAAFLGVALGAFGAHGLSLDASENRLWETATLYLFVHALALLAVGLSPEAWPGAWRRAAGWLFAAGSALFSGSLYVLALAQARILGAVTPVGGLCLLLGWMCLAAAAMPRRPRRGA